MVSKNGVAKQEEIKQMEYELRKIEQNLYEEYCEIGKIILEKAEQENKKINIIVDQIIEARCKLAEVKEKKYCLECDTLNDYNALYCKRCGIRFADTNNTEEDNNGTK